MHILLQKLGREIVRLESPNNPGKRRFLLDLMDISDVFENNTGTNNVLGIRLGTSEINEPLFIDDKSFEGMRNLQFINFCKGWCPHKTGEVFCLPHQGLVYFPRKLKLLHWDDYPAKYIPSNIKTEHLVKLIMKDSKLEKLWEGAQPLRSLKMMMLSGSRDLQEVPDLSNATNLEKLQMSRCASLVTLPSSIRNLKKLTDLCLGECSNLEVLPPNVNLECLDYLNLTECSRLRSFPRIARNISRLYLDGTAMEEEDCFWIENLSRLTVLEWENCPLRCMPSNFHPEHLVQLHMRASKLEKIWEGVQLLTNLMWMHLESSENLKEIPDLSKATSLTELILSGCKNLKVIPDLSKATNLVHLDLSECENLKEILDLSKATSLTELILSGCKNLKQIPDLPKATNLTELDLSGCENLKEISNLSKATSLEILVLDDCTSLVKLPSSIQHLDKLRTLNMRGCTSLEVLPTNINLVSLTSLDLSECSRLTSFPQLSTSIEELDLSDTAIEEVPSWIENIAKLTHLSMRRCEKLKIIPANMWNLKHLKYVDFTDCGGVTSVSDTNLVKTAVELHEETYLFCSDFLSCSDSDTELLFHNCFNLDQDAQKSILQSDFRYAILPSKEVPTYFTHRTRGSCLTVPLPQSSLSQKHLGFRACMIIDGNECPKNITVHWKFRGVTDMFNIYLSTSSCLPYHHLLVFHFGFCPGEEVNDSPSQSDCNSVKFEFELHSACIWHCYSISGTKDRNLQTCPDFPYKVKECGVRALNVSPSQDANNRSSEIEYMDQSGENDEETERSKKRIRMTEEPSQVHSNLPGGKTAVNSGSMAPCVEEEARSSEQSGRMTVETPIENFNSLCGQTAVNSGSMALNLELSLGPGQAPPRVSSRSKLPSPSISSGNCHGVEASLNLSLSPFDPCLEGEPLYFDPMITEQQDALTSSEDHSLSPQLTNYFI